MGEVLYVMFCKADCIQAIGPGHWGNIASVVYANSESHCSSEATTELATH